MSKINWWTAPEDAQFYSFGKFRKYESNQEFYYNGESWLLTPLDGMEWHERRKDFEMRPQQEILVYTGQMTADQLEKIKIRIESVEHGKAFREMLSKVTQHSTEGLEFLNRSLFMFVDNDGRLTYKDSDLAYFNKHSYQEIKWQLLGL